MNLPINILSEYRDDDADHISFELNPQFARRLKLLRDTIKKVKAAYIEEWDYPDILNTNDEESDLRSECSTLKVSDTDFHWEGIIKHSECRWESDCCNFDGVDEVLKVANCRRKNLPLLIGSLKCNDAKILLEKRMKR
jgi:hypothetical protein